MTTNLPPRPSALFVSEALRQRGDNPASADVLATELLHLRACIERCKSAQRVTTIAAMDWEAKAEHWKSHGPWDNQIIAEARAVELRFAATELEKALEGF